MTKLPPKWTEMATREGKGRAPTSWQTPEGIAVKPVYTAQDLEGLGHLGSLPAHPRHIRPTGPRRR